MSASVREQIQELQELAEALRIVDFNERKQEFFCRACRYRDPLGPDGNKLHDDNCPWVDFVRQFKVVLDATAALTDAAAEGDHKGCPCQFGNPCHERCTCVMPFSSRGCRRCCRYGSREQQEAAAKRIIGAEGDLERELRELWWAGHGCVTALYGDGDDGEMQCSKHLIDFKRMPLNELRERVRRIKWDRAKEQFKKKFAEESCHAEILGYRCDKLDGHDGEHQYRTAMTTEDAGTLRHQIENLPATLFASASLEADGVIPAWIKRADVLALLEAQRT